jgi:hypothetical protein
MTFDDLGYARSIMADREREAGRARLARLARAAASCCEGRLAALRRTLSLTPTLAPRTRTGR